MEGSANPFGVIVAAQLRSVLATDDEERLGWKVGLIRGLYERGYGREKILELYRFIDWLITLPEGLAERFHAQVTQIEEEKKMPYITTAERIGIEKGIRQGMEKGMEKGMERGIREGLVEGILLAIELRFGREGSRLESQLGKIRSLVDLRSIKDLAKTAPDLDILKKEIIRLSPQV